MPQLEEKKRVEDPQPQPQDETNKHLLKAMVQHFGELQKMGDTEPPPCEGVRQVQRALPRFPDLIGTIMGVKTVRMRAMEAINEAFHETEEQDIPDELLEQFTRAMEVLFMSELVMLQSIASSITYWKDQTLTGEEFNNPNLVVHMQNIIMRKYQQQAEQHELAELEQKSKENSSDIE